MNKHSGKLPQYATKKIRVGIIVLLSMLPWTRASADITDLFPFLNSLELRAAQAALSTYTSLITSGCIDTAVVDPGVGPCSGQVFTLFTNVRELIHNANELTSDGSTGFSLGLNLQDFGFALRWTAAEEYAAQGSLSSDFSRGQLSGLSTRLGALRMGARGFSVNASQFDPGNLLYADNGEALSGGGAADDGYSRWGGFVNYIFGAGVKDPTSLEDAFDFDGTAVNFGIDYRINSRWIAGLIGGVTEQEIDFNSNLSIVDGGIISEGYSWLPFIAYQNGSFFFSASISLQELSFATRRDISYPSLNILTPSVNTTTVSDTDAAVFSYFGEIGYTWRWNQFSFEAFANADSSTIEIDAFLEDDLNDDAFDLNISDQTIDQTELTVGAKFQYVLTPSFGVFIPYFNLELINQTETDASIVNSRYANAISQQNTFFVPTDELDSSYSVYTVGVSAVLRGGERRSDGGVIAGGLQGFVQYKLLDGLENYDIDGVAFGFRYEF
jgi:hypothetical protein